MSISKQRYDRIAQAKHRGTKASHKTELENTLILLAWEAEILSEGQCSRMLNLDRMSLRNLRMEMLDRATKFAEELNAPHMLALKAEIAAHNAQNPTKDKP